MVVYLVLINAVAFIFMCADKHFAKKRMPRISERTLMLSAALGGSLGAWLGMYLVRHKTKHPKFYIGVPLILTVQAAALFFWYHLQ